MSLYADYLAERTDDQVIENEHGFVTFRFLAADDGASACFIVDMYVRPDMRLLGIGKKLADEVTSKAEARGCRELICTTFSHCKGWRDSQKAIVAYGFTPVNNVGDMTIFKKDL